MSAPSASPPVTIVTGGAGWLGRNLLSTLATEGRRLRCLVAQPQDRAVVDGVAPGAEQVVGDVRDPVAVSRLFDGTEGATVLHVASVIHPAGRTRELFDVNVGGTAHVIEGARRHHVRRLVYVSSNSPFGFNRSADDQFDEDSPYEPHLAYGQSKMEAERLVSGAHRRGDVDTSIVRAPWFYGPFQPPRQTRFLAAVRRGRFPLVGSGENRRSLVYTDNLVQGVLLAERTPSAGGRAYWIADARPYPMTEILDAVRAACTAHGLAVAPRRAPHLPGLASEVALIADRLVQGRGRYVQAIHVLSEMNKTIACSIDRARRDLGYEPTVELFEGMRRSVRWCLDEGVAL